MLTQQIYQCKSWLANRVGLIRVWLVHKLVGKTMGVVANVTLVGGTLGLDTSKFILLINSDFSYTTFKGEHKEVLDEIMSIGG
jgi:hypothetical protein